MSGPQLKLRTPVPSGALPKLPPLPAGALLREIERSFRVTADPYNDSRGVAVVLPVNPVAAHALDIPGGLPASTLHVTLAYLGKVEDLYATGGARALKQLARALNAVARGRTPLLAKLQGTGRFPGQDGTDACWVGVEAPELLALRSEVLKCIRRADLTYSKLHAYVPHVTAGYVQADAANPLHPKLSVSSTFSQLALWVGDRQVVFPFGGQMSKAVPTPSLSSSARRDVRRRGRYELGHGDALEQVKAARLLYTQLTADLVRCEEIDRKIVGALTTLEQQHGQAAAALAKPIRDMRGSALEEAFLDHAEQRNVAARLIASMRD
jgi:2'-5' RNA ligase